MVRNIVKYKKQALVMFSKNELKLFFFSWIKTCKESFFVFIKYFWWLIVAEIIFKANIFPMQNHHILSMLVTTIISMFSLYFAILAIRASLGIKDAYYFISNLKKIFTFAILFFFVVTTLNTIIFYNTGISLYTWALSTSLGGVNLIFQIMCALFILISTLFLLDYPSLAINTIAPIKNTCKGIGAYSPFFVVLTLLYLALYYSVSGLCYFFPCYISTASILLLNFVFACAVGVTYLQIRHSNYKFFFGSNN